jgi:uncharacterized lipoprotein YmbA
MRVTSLLLVILLSGCAGKAIEPSYYLMRSDQNLTSGQLNPSRDFAMGNVIIASYIDQPGLLVETQDGEIRAAQQNLWAEPVYEGVRNQIIVALRAAKGQDLLPADLNQDAIVLDIRLDQLHGTNDGKAKVVAYWWLRRGKEVLAAYQFAEEQALAADGYAALVNAEQALLDQLADRIAATLVVPEQQD